jgi:cell division protease FtsH
VVPIPDIDGREKILGVHMKKVPLAPDVNPRVIARGTPGFSGADLANLVNEAALLAARRNKRLVAMQEFEDAKDKVMMGAERRSHGHDRRREEDDRLSRGRPRHRLGARAASDPIHKATIIPRGRALGMVMRLPERDSYSYHRDKMHANLSVAMGGRVAEEIIFGHDKVSRALRPTSSMPPIWRATWSPSGACRTSSARFSTKAVRKAISAWGQASGRCSGQTNKLIDAEIKQPGRRRPCAGDRYPQDP